MYIINESKGIFVIVFDLLQDFFLSTLIYIFMYILSGYGHQAPVTFEGRLFVVFYALIGIPLFGVVLIGIGGKIAILMNVLKKKVFMPKKRSLERGIKVAVVGTSGLAILICIPAVVFTHMENWTYGESVYFAIITLTTIGFGDYVVGKNQENMFNIFGLYNSKHMYLYLLENASRFAKR